MGFVLGPILRRADIGVRRDVVRQLTPRTLFLMPTISIIAGTTGSSSPSGSTTLSWLGRNSAGSPRRSPW